MQWLFRSVFLKESYFIYVLLHKTSNTIDISVLVKKKKTDYFISLCLIICGLPKVLQFPSLWIKWGWGGSSFCPFLKQLLQCKLRSGLQYFQCYFSRPVLLIMEPQEKEDLTVNDIFICVQNLYKRLKKNLFAGHFSFWSAWITASTSWPRTVASCQRFWEAKL